MAKSLFPHLEHTSGRGAVSSPSPPPEGGRSARPFSTPSRGPPESISTRFPPWMCPPGGRNSWCCLTGVSKQLQKLWSGSVHGFHSLYLAWIPITTRPSSVLTSFGIVRRRNSSSADVGLTTRTTRPMYEKCWTAVRKLIGYDRYESKEAQDLQGHLRELVAIFELLSAHPKACGEEEGRGQDAQEVRSGQDPVRSGPRFSGLGGERKGAATEGVPNPGSCRAPAQG